jgi:hypothetical protein
MLLLYTFLPLNTSWLPFPKNGSFMHPLDEVRTELELDV